jgi:serine/threonine protein kinase
VRNGGSRALNEGPSQREGAPSGDELVAGKYELVRLIGRGGMGSVWEGRHVTLGTRVACKFIDADFASKSPEARTRFKNEARAAASLRSKHVVEVHDYGVMSDGRPYIVMEFLAGESLADRLERVGRLPLAVTVRVVHQVGRALQKAHAAGIVHRDLKPDNIFLMWDEEDEQDQVKVVDFGIAKFTDEGVNVSHATQTGSVVGTPFFMSPEQARGIEVIDLRSDLWALGVVTFQCLTGQLPFYSEAVGDLLIKICTGEIPVPSHVSPDLPLAMDAWMARALERDRDVRFQSAREMTEALAEAIGPFARSLLDSHADEERAGIRQRRHLTAGPRAGRVVTGSSHPPSVLPVAARTAVLENLQPGSTLRRYAPMAAVIVLLVGLGGVWLLSRAATPTDAGQALAPAADLGAEPSNAAPTTPAADRPLKLEVEGTPLSELAVEPSRTAPSAASRKQDSAPRRPAAWRAESADDSASAQPHDSPAPTSSAATVEPGKDSDISLGY